MLYLDVGGYPCAVHFSPTYRRHILGVHDQVLEDVLTIRWKVVLTFLSLKDITL